MRGKLNSLLHKIPEVMWQFMGVIKIPGSYLSALPFSVLISVLMVYNGGWSAKLSFFRSTYNTLDGICLLALSSGVMNRF